MSNREAAAASERVVSNSALTSGGYMTGAALQAQMAASERPFPPLPEVCLRDKNGVEWFDTLAMHMYVLADRAATAPQAVRMPELPKIPPEDCIPYEAIRYVPGYTASYVMQYAINYAEATLRLNGIVPLAPQDTPTLDHLRRLRKSGQGPAA